MDHDHIVEQSTTKKLLDFRPLTETQSKFRIDPVRVRMRTGHVPWIGTRVRIIAGVHKGKPGIVRDVNRPSRGFEESGLAVSVELQVISPNMSHRIEMIDYARICEFDSGLELAKFFPLTEKQDFYTPWAGKKKREGRGKLPVMERTVPATSNPYLSSSKYDDIDLDDPYNPWNPHSISPGVWSAPEFLSPPASPLGPIASLNTDPSSIPETPASPDPSLDALFATPAPLSHPLLHPKLLGISIRVAIISGRWKRKTAFVTPTSSENGPFFAFRLKGETHRIDHQCIGRHAELPKPNSEQGLMVVTRGADRHIGKFVRRVTYFYNEKKSDSTRWLIVAVVDRSGSQDAIKSELLEVSPGDVDLVEESVAQREAGNLLFESVRYAAKVGRPEVRRPGEGDLGHLYASISEASVL
ncbi:hypothetical protein V5O48_007252 [Marasmius crinis-equi]|uniref:KOW domain-containing protein n=1 Tax=Marasmius crinis-equi TaxID=585013 RepID=A0ABR3FH85_9AGAR